MPELPEVETTRLSLLPGVRGRRITAVALKRPDLRVPFPKALARQLTGRRITDIRRRAKYLLFDLDNGAVMLAHLGMSGSFLLAGPTHALRKHDHMLVTLDNGQILVFHDPRRFGLIEWIAKGEEGENPYLAHLGPEPLDPTFTPVYLASVLATRKGPLKPTLMDQRIVVGVGNIYASESLFLAKLHPATPSHLAVPHAATLVKCIRTSLRAALASGGSSLRDYTSGTGNAGYFQHQFNVYEREGEPCVACGHEIVATVQAARSTYYCANCQKLPSSNSGIKKNRARKKAKK